jgi:hypothetical protein
MNLKRRIERIEAKQGPKPAMTPEQRRIRLNELCTKAGTTPDEILKLTASYGSTRAAIREVCSRRALK